MPLALFIDTGIAQLGEEGLGERGLIALARVAPKTLEIRLEKLAPISAHAMSDATRTVLLTTTLTYLMTPRSLRDVQVGGA